MGNSKKDKVAGFYDDHSENDLSVDDEETVYELIEEEDTLSGKSYDEQIMVLKHAQEAMALQLDDAFIDFDRLNRQLKKSRQRRASVTSYVALIIAFIALTIAIVIGVFLVGTREKINQFKPLLETHQHSNNKNNINTKYIHARIDDLILKINKNNETKKISSQIETPVVPPFLPITTPTEKLNSTNEQKNKSDKNKKTSNQTDTPVVETLSPITTPIEKLNPTDEQKNKSDENKKSSNQIDTPVVETLSPITTPTEKLNPTDEQKNKSDENKKSSNQTDTPVVETLSPITTPTEKLNPTDEQKNKPDKNKKWKVVLGSYRNLLRAQRNVHKYNQKGVSTRISSVKGRGSYKWHRIVTESFSTKREATRYSKKIKGKLRIVSMMVTQH